MKRRFENAGKFWEIDYTGSVQIRWGKIGEAPQRLDRGLDDRVAKLAYVERQIAAQIARGYVEVTIAEVAPQPPRSRHLRFEWELTSQRRFQEIVQLDFTIHYRRGNIVDGKDHVETSNTSRLPSTAAAVERFDQLCDEARYHGGTPVDPSRDAARAIRGHVRRHGDDEAMSNPLAEPAGSASHADLEKQCLDSPDDPAPWQVYADWLETQGDRRAEVAALDRSGMSPAAKIRELLRGIADEDDVEEDLIGSSDREVTIDCELQFGFVRRATITIAHESAIPLDVATRRFLGTPLARFVDSLRFGLAGFESNNDWTPTLRTVVESAQARHLRALAFDHFDTESEISWVEFGDFTGLLEQLPALERLHIKSGGGGTFGPLVLPTLRTFIFESGGLGQGELTEIKNARWPALEHLEIWTGSTDHGAAATIDTLRDILDGQLPALRHLGIVNSELVEELIPMLATGRILPQLESLDLSNGIASSDATIALVRHAPAFRHLAALDLSHNTLTPDQVEQIRAVLDNVIVTKQRELTGEDRYVVVGE